MNIDTLYALYLSHPKVVTDSRCIEEGAIFFALKGDRFNGNAYAEEALRKGASYAIIDEEVYKTHERVLLVDNVLSSLQQVAAYHRKKLGIPILALTGSNGKTTTKELLHLVLAKKFKTVATQGNLNNHIGVPLTLLAMDATTHIGVVEMGANHQGEIAFLSSLAMPDYGCITNFGKAHLEGFGGVEGVIKGKSELYEHLMQHEKTIFYNADDAIQVNALKNYPKKYGFSKQAGRGNLLIELHSEKPFLTVTVADSLLPSQLTGAYNFTNIALAITAGLYFEIPLHKVKEAIEEYEPANNRSQLMEKNGHTIILDAYNANPTSMKAALDNLVSFPGSRKVALLGDMFELGDEALKEHQAVVNYLETLGLNEVHLVGVHFCNTRTSFPVYKDIETLKKFLHRHPLPPATILIKGSRGMAMERVLEFL